MKIFKHNQKGFTVLELIIVSAIMVMLLTLVTVNFKGFDNKSVLDSESDKLFSVLRQAQIWSLTGHLQNGERYSYGVYFEECSTTETCSYFLFTDLDGDKVYDLGEGYKQGEYKMIKGAYVSSLVIEGSTSIDELSVVFEPPLGTIYFNGLEDYDSADVILKHITYDAEQVIKVNRISGQINIE